MKFNDRALYHQIHPAKLASDWLTTPIALYFFWQHHLVAGLVATLLPPIAASAIIMRYADLDPYRSSRFGRYIARHMTPSMMTVRLWGEVIMSVAAWLHRPIWLPVGLLVVLFGWSRGLLFTNWASCGAPSPVQFRERLGLWRSLLRRVGVGAEPALHAAGIPR